MRPKGSAETLIRRRRAALTLLDQGFSLTEVASRVGCGPASVVRWRDTRASVGDDVFTVRCSPGRPAKLKARQKTALLKMLKDGPRAGGIDADRWSTALVVELIERSFGVRYHPDHIYRLLQSPGAREFIIRRKRRSKSTEPNPPVPASQEATHEKDARKLEAEAIPQAAGHDHVERRDRSEGRSGADLLAASRLPQRAVDATNAAPVPPARQQGYARSG